MICEIKFGAKILPAYSNIKVNPIWTGRGAKCPEGFC